jgi:hypothetical protein
LEIGLVSHPHLKGVYYQSIKQATCRKGFEKELKRFAGLESKRMERWTDNKSGNELVGASGGSQIKKKREVKINASALQQLGGPYVL